MTFAQAYRQCPDFPNRYISPQKLFFFLEKNYSGLIREMGRSYLHKPIYMLTLGTGQTKVLAWSQMHGNESNATHAMLDMLITLQESPSLSGDIFNQISLDFIFMLNPDGSEQWTRRNPLEIDMNRDFLKLSSKEFPILKNVAETGNYDYALNLHEQRTIFTTDGENPATLSFLAPAENFEREITSTRKKAMSVIAAMVKALPQEFHKNIARYSDEFYPTSTGDNFTKMGLPTILYEGGHYPNDYQRFTTRKYYTVALYEGLKAISHLNGSDEGWEQYFELPENKESHYDLIYRNVRLNTDFDCVLDIAVQYKEIYRKGEDEISFVPYVVEVGDCGKKKGWKEIDCIGKTFVSERKFPKLDAEVDFEIR